MVYTLGTLHSQRPAYLGSHDAILRIDRTQLDRLAAKAPQQSVRIAPSVVRGVRSRTQIVDIHRRKPGFELLRREQIDRATFSALPLHIALEVGNVVRRDDEEIAAFDPIHRRRTAIGRHRLLERLDETDAVERHRDVFRAGELDAAAAGGAKGGGEFVGGVGLDYADRQSWGFFQEEVDGGGPHDATADDGNVEGAPGLLTHLGKLDPGLRRDDDLLQHQL